jgi:hypothetical protein
MAVKIAYYPGNTARAASSEVELVMKMDKLVLVLEKLTM